MKINPYVELILAVLLFGFTGIFIKLIELPSQQIGFIRLLFPALFFAGYLIYKKNSLWHYSKLLYLAAILNALRVWMYILGFSFTSIGNAVITLYTWPIFATILGAIFLREKVSNKTKVLSLISFVGIFILFSSQEFSFQNDDLLGMLFVLMAGLLIALNATIFKNELKKYSAVQVVYVQSFVGTLLFLPFMFIMDTKLTFYQWNLGFLFGLVVGIIGFWLYFSSMKQIPVSIVSQFSYLEIISALILAYIFFNEVVELNVVIGGLIIICSTYLIAKENKVK